MTDEQLVIKYMYDILNCKLGGAEYTKQIGYAKSLVKKYGLTNMLFALDYCSYFPQRNFRNTYYLKENAELLISNGKKLLEALIEKNKQPDEILVNVAETNRRMAQGNIKVTKWW